MRTLFITLIAVLLGATGGGTGSASPIPDYAKWGLIAVKETQAKYDVDILDYKHIGRSPLSGGLSQEQFKLWVKDKNGKEFAVYVHVNFNPDTQMLKNVEFTVADQ